jgi:antitoxin VapB
VALANETKTEAIRKALLDRKSRLQAAVGRPGRKAQLLDYLGRSVWPKVPPGVLGRLSRKEEDAILGYGPQGHFRPPAAAPRIETTEEHG